MSINFATLKGLAIPEGNVTQIADASGRVLWKQAPSGANVKITTPDSGNASFPNIIINGVNYNNTDIEYELVVPIGTVVEVAGYYLNGICMAGNYTITGDVEIQRYTHVTPPSPPTSFSPTVTVRIIIIEL